MSVIWITAVPDFYVEEGGIRVVLTSGSEEIQIGLSRYHCRLAAARATKVLNNADRAQERRLTRMQKGPAPA